MLALAATAVLLLVLVGGLALTSAVAASHRARAGADLAALAAAAAVQQGATDAEACERAALVASGNATRQRRCEVFPDGSVIVGTTARAGLALPGPAGGQARATARAGPAPSL